MAVSEGKRQTKTAEQFAENLKLYYGKTNEQDTDEIDTAELFRKAMKKE